MLDLTLSEIILLWRGTNEKAEKKGKNVSSKTYWAKTCKKGIGFYKLESNENILCLQILQFHILSKFQDDL